MLLVYYSTTWVNDPSFEVELAEKVSNLGTNHFSFHGGGGGGYRRF